MAVSDKLNWCDGAFTKLNGLNNTGYDYDVYCSTLLRFFAKYAPIGTKLTMYGKVLLSVMRIIESASRTGQMQKLSPARKIVGSSGLRA